MPHLPNARSAAAGRLPPERCLCPPAPPSALPNKPSGERGFSLTEVLIALVVSLIVASIAYPAYQAQVTRGRRAEAVAALLALQQSQEKWRGLHGSYAAMADLSSEVTTTNGLYMLDVQQCTTTGYVLVARALGGQAQDRLCSTLKLTVDGGQTTTSSGTDELTINAETPNRRCWSQ